MITVLMLNEFVQNLIERYPRSQQYCVHLNTDDYQSIKTVTGVNKHGALLLFQLGWHKDVTIPHGGAITQISTRHRFFHLYSNIYGKAEGPKKIKMDNNTYRTSTLQQMDEEIRNLPELRYYQVPKQEDCPCDRFTPPCECGAKSLGVLNHAHWCPQNKA